MLSRVAERVYWLARYMERVENTARLAKVHSQLMFDLPKSVKLSWFTLIEITSNEYYFEQHYDVKSEQNCMSALLSDRDNVNSLISCLWFARENMRTTRDILPREAWLLVNELYLELQNNQNVFLIRTKRNQTLEKIIRSCQAWSGMLSSTMSHNETYRFLKLGMSLERADMTTRILDVGGYFVAQEVFKHEEAHYEGILWAHILKSASAYFMYRQEVQTEVSGSAVVDFLMHDAYFARSALYCIQLMKKMAELLPHNERLVQDIDALLIKLSKSVDFSIGSNDLHNYLDEMQIQFAYIHTRINELWFNPEVAA